MFLKQWTESAPPQKTTTTNKQKIQRKEKWRQGEKTRDKTRNEVGRGGVRHETYWIQLANKSTTVHPFSLQQHTENGLTAPGKTTAKEQKTAGSYWPVSVGITRGVSSPDPLLWFPAISSNAADPSDRSSRLLGVWKINTNNYILRSSTVAVLHLFSDNLMWLVHYKVWLGMVMMMMKWCLMSSDVSWHIRDKLRPVPKHGLLILYIHGNQKAR